VSWCSVSINSLQICDDHELIQFKVLEESQHQFQFKGSMVLPNVAVAANYIYSTSGGMQWISPRWMGHQEYIRTSELPLYIVFAVVALLVPMYFLFRKLRRMTQIEVDIPDILFKSMEPTNDPKSDSSVETVVPGNFAPKAVIDIYYQMDSFTKRKIGICTFIGFSWTNWSSTGRILRIMRLRIEGKFF